MPLCIRHQRANVGGCGRMWDIWEDEQGGRAGNCTEKFFRKRFSARDRRASAALPHCYRGWALCPWACSLPCSAASSGPGSASAQGCTIRTEGQRCARARSRAGGAPRPVLRQKHVMSERPTPEGKRALYGGHGGAVDGVQHTHYNKSGGQIIPWGNREGGAARSRRVKLKLFPKSLGNGG